MKLTPRDKKVIDSFIAKKPMVSKKLSTDGKVLNKNAQLYSHLEYIGVAEWGGSHIKQVSDYPEELATIVNYMTKEALRRGISVFDFWGREKKLKAITLTPKDKKVIESFIAKRPARSRKLESYGHSLECLLTSRVLFQHDVTGDFVIRDRKSQRGSAIHRWHDTVFSYLKKKSRKDTILAENYKNLAEYMKDILREKTIEFNEVRSIDRKPSERHIQEVWESGLIDEEIRRVDEAISDYQHMTDVGFQD
jgi:hypothetical protein